MEDVVYDVRLSSVVPARVTGENKVHELRNMDLAMKLHYIKGLYFFDSDAVNGLDIFDLKEPMFQLLDLYYPTSGRIRQSDKSRPFIKCNDGGVRIVEAHCIKTLDEWLASKDPSLDDRLTYNQPLGPDLSYSPLVYIQFTWFKCGGLSVGLSWAHVLGDAFSASAFINMWGQIMAGDVPPQPLNMPNTGNCQFHPEGKPFSLEMVEPVGNYWLNASDYKLEAHSFHVTSKQLHHIASETRGSDHDARGLDFELLSALVWKSLARVRGNSEPRIVTICRNGNRKRENEIPCNGQVIGTVEADFTVANANLLELAKLITEKVVDERKMIEEMVETENEKSDFVVYGANLTFINLEDAKVYDLKIKGHDPVFVNYMISGIGGGGVVLVFPAPENVGGGGRDGRTVTVKLRKDEILGLKNELREEWGIC